MNEAQAAALRAHIAASIPDLLHETPFEERFLVLPDAHLKALDPARPLVTGARGTGKTFWWEALAFNGAELLPALFPREHSRTRFELRVAFGGKKLNVTSAPQSSGVWSEDVLAPLLGEYGARPLWKTLLLDAIEPTIVPASRTLRERVAWVQAHAEEVERDLDELDRRLASENSVRIAIFDAVDRVSLDWPQLITAHRDLARLTLEFQGYRALRTKVFLRTDIANEPEVFRFPDASKLRTSMVDLRWEPTALYSLLWQYLGNGGPGSAAFRSLAEGRWTLNAKIWSPPRDLREDQARQAAVWHKIVGKFMGAGPRKGNTYGWITNHLADAHERVSPRSFLTAVRVAAEHSVEGTTPLQHSALHDGVRAASKVRAAEIEEDFPWMNDALQALEEVLVPCPSKTVLRAWEQNTEFMHRLDEPQGRRRKSYGQGLDALVAELSELGVFTRMRDGRINVPDLYRLGFKLLRKGGVRPAR